MPKPRHLEPGKTEGVEAVVAQGLLKVSLRFLSTPEEKCIDFPEQKYISEAGKKGR